MKPLLVAACVLFVVAPAFGEERRTLVQTNDDRDVAVIGGGFLEAEDDAGTRYLVQSARLEEDAEGRLCAEHEGRLLRLVPHVHIPDDAEKALISPTGDVSVVTRSHQLVSVGSLSAALVRHRVGVQRLSPGILSFDSPAIPVRIGFGEGSKNYLMQGWIDGGAPCDQ